VKTKAIETPNNWRDLKRHPLSAEYPDLLQDGAKRMCTGLKVHGNIGDRRITLFDGKVLDGWQFLKACNQENVEPRFQELVDGDPATFVEILNDTRRHEDIKTMMRRAKKRRERVRAARKQGQSIRTIAKSENVSPATILSDLNTSGVQGEHLPEKVEGSDGKTYSATQTKLIPEIVQMNLSPKFTPALEDMPRGKQQDFVRLVNDGKSVRSALKAVENQREAGDDTGQIKAEKAAEKAKPKIGAEKFDWKEFHGHFRALMRMPDRVGDAYDPKCKNTPQADALRKQLDDWEKSFKVWFREIAKQEPPKE
jgi:hypothetical protein